MPIGDEFKAMPAAHTTLKLDGKPLSFAQLTGIVAGRITLAADGDAMLRVRETRQVLEDHITAGHPVYGATTGVGAMKDVSWTNADRDSFNLGLVRAHSFGTGDAFPVSVIRSAMAIRVNMALSGHVGVTTEFVDIYLAMMEADLVPVVRRTGSIGCADIGLMGQIGSVLTGAGEVYVRGNRTCATKALADAGIAPMTFAPRDSLASISTNAIAYAAAAHGLRDAAGAIRMALATGLTAAGALAASRDPWLAVSQVGGAREAVIGGWLNDNAEIWGWSEATHVQDPLSLRMMGQVFGAAFDALMVAGRTVLTATGRTDDNPVVVNGRVLTSGGSLPLDVTLFLQTAQLAIAHVARNSFNRCVLLGNGGRRGLPVNLVPHGVIATGMGPIIKLAGELFARVLSLSSSISAQSMVVAGGMEDEATFMPLVVERFERQVLALRRLAALEAVLAAQAMDIAADTPKGVGKLIYDTVRGHAAFYDMDRPLSQEVEAIEDDLASDATMAALLALSAIDEVDDFFALGSGHPA